MPPLFRLCEAVLGLLGGGTALVTRISRLLASCAMTAVVLAPGRAEAYSFETLISDGCHERITMDALRAVRSVRGVEWRETEAADVALLDDLPFHVDADLRDFGAASLLVANREVDLVGKNPTDAFELAELHGDPNVQVEHCLRSPQDDGVLGAEAALSRCRTYVLDEFQRALGGRSAESKPTRKSSVFLTTSLGTRGTTRVSLPRYYFHLGRALHALQDSFTHTLRTENAKGVVTVLNWVDWQTPAYSIDRDGIDHKSALDACADATPRSKARRLMAIEASSQLLAASMKPEAEAMEDAKAIVVEYMSLSKSCSDTVGYCGALDDAAALSSCNMGPHRPAPGSEAVAGCLLIASLFRFRRRRTRALPLLGFAILAPGTERDVYAGDSPPEAASASAASVSHERSMFGIAGSVSASLDRPALAFALGPRVRVSDHWVFGLDSEWNPWISVQDARIRSGAFNQSFVSILRYDLGPVALRMTARAGISVLLYDLYSASAGSVGPLFGVNILGLEVPLSRSLKLIVDPADLAVAVPSLRAAPLVHRQYRLTVGIQWGSN